MKIKDQLHNSATHGEAPNKDCPVCIEHVPFDISCNRLRSTLRYMEAHSAQGSLTPEDKNAIWQAVAKMDKTVSEVLAHASVRRDNQIETLGPLEVEACKNPTLGPIIHLECCVCGAATVGRQWWNRDTGFGVCAICGIISKAHESEEVERLYGVRGVHWDVVG